MSKKLKITIIVICLIIPILFSFIFIDLSPESKSASVNQEIAVKTPETEANTASGNWISYYTQPSGSGAENDPYIITSAENLAWMAWYTKNVSYISADKYFKQNGRY